MVAIYRTTTVQLAAAISANSSVLGSGVYLCDNKFATQQHRIAVVVSNTGTDCIAIAGSPDGATFVTIATSLSAANPVTIMPGPWAYLRVDKTAVGGAATVLLVY